MHRPGIEPGSPAWQASILPLNHRCSKGVTNCRQHRRSQSYIHRRCSLTAAEFAYNSVTRSVSFTILSWTPASIFCAKAWICPFRLLQLYSWWAKDIFFGIDSDWIMCHGHSQLLPTVFVVFPLSAFHPVVQYVKLFECSYSATAPFQSPSYEQKVWLFDEDRVWENKMCLRYERSFQHAIVKFANTFFAIVSSRNNIFL